MSSCRLVLAIAALVALLQGCSTLPGTVDPTLVSIDDSRLPRTDVAASIPGLGPCTDNPDRTLRLNSGHPVTVLVHGCYGSSGQFRALAQVLAFHGQQTACFTYDDRAALDASAAELAASIDRLLKLMTTPMPEPPVTIIGHSQGALITRRALTANQRYVIGAADTRMELVTISGPFAGIAAADACGSPVVRALSSWTHCADVQARNGRQVGGHYVFVGLHPQSRYLEQTGRAASEDRHRRARQLSTRCSMAGASRTT